MMENRSIACEQFNSKMLRLYPHHGLEKWLIVCIFYNSVIYSTRMTVDVVAIIRNIKK